MLPLVYHLQKVSFSYEGVDFSYFVIAQHPDHAREVLAHHLSFLNGHDEIATNAREYSYVQFIATLVNNENIIPCVLEV